LRTYIFVGGSGVVGLPIVRHFNEKGYKVCVVDLNDPAQFGLDVPFHQADLLNDPVDSLLPEDCIANSSQVVVLNLAMVRTIENGGAKDVPDWHNKSLDRNPIFARNVANACCYYNQKVIALYYISTFSIFDLRQHASLGLLIPENISNPCILATDGYAKGKRDGEKETEKALEGGIISTGTIRLSTPQKEEVFDSNWIASGRAWALTDKDCVFGVRLILTQEHHPPGHTSYNLNSFPSLIKTTNAIKVGFVHQ